METNQNIEETCCYCGKPESAMGTFKARDFEDGALVCQGICQIGLEVDATHSDDWE